MPGYFPKLAFDVLILALGIASTNVRPAAAAVTNAVAGKSPNTKRAFPHVLKNNQGLNVDNSADSSVPQVGAPWSVENVLLPNPMIYSRIKSKRREQWS